jgi:hypothetical protein
MPNISAYAGLPPVLKTKPKQGVEDIMQYGGMFRADGFGKEGTTLFPDGP